MKPWLSRPHPATLLIAPWVWLAHFVVVYAATSLACGSIDPHAASPRAWAIGAVVLATAVGVAFSLYAGVANYRQWRGEPRNSERSASAFVRKVNMLLYALAILGMLLVALPAFMLAPCASVTEIESGTHVASVDASG
jgi:hypothetical protein